MSFYSPNPLAQVCQKPASPISFAQGARTWNPNPPVLRTRLDFVNSTVPTPNGSPIIPQQQSYNIAYSSPSYDRNPLHENFGNMSLVAADPIANSKNLTRASGAEVRFASPIAQTQSYSPAQIQQSEDSVSAAKSTTPPKTVATGSLKPTTTSQRKSLKPQIKEEEKKEVNKPALRPKTIAFGKTVNVSQTIEGTSRAAKSNLTRRLPSMSSVPVIREDNKENEDIEETSNQNTMTPELRAPETSNLGREIAELRNMVREISRESETQKKELTEAKKEINALKKKDKERAELLVKIEKIMQDVIRKQLAQSAPPKNRPPSPCMAVVPSPARAPIRQDRRNTDDKTNNIFAANAELFARIMERDPLFKRQIHDVLADAEDHSVDNDAHVGRAGDNFRNSNDRNQRKTKNPNDTCRAFAGRSPPRRPEHHTMPTTFTQKVTVERHFNVPSHYSTATKNFIKERNLTPRIEPIVESEIGNYETFCDPIADAPCSEDNWRNCERYTVQSPVEDNSDRFNGFDEDDDDEDVLMDRTPRCPGSDGRIDRKDRLKAIREKRKMNEMRNESAF